MKFISPSILIAFFIDTCARKQFFHFHLTVKIDLVYYLKQVFHLLYDKCVTPTETLTFTSLI